MGGLERLMVRLARVHRRKVFFEGRGRDENAQLAQLLTQQFGHIVLPLSRRYDRSSWWARSTPT